MVSSDGRRQDGCTGSTARTIVDVMRLSLFGGSKVEVVVVVLETRWQLHHHHPTLT